MPRYHVARSASSTGKARHQKSFACGLRTLNAGGTEISDTFSIGANVNVRQVTLSHLAVSYEAPSIAYGDTHCALTGADGYLEVPNSPHAFIDGNGGTLGELGKKAGGGTTARHPDGVLHSPPCFSAIGGRGGDRLPLLL